MPRKRSRPKTEEKFQNAVLELVAENGLGHLGINAVAQRAGADKVLIYRYFGDFDGLLQTVAQSRSWLPDVEEILEAIQNGSKRAIEVIHQIEQQLERHFRSDQCLQQLLRWRRADRSPLSEAFSREWRTLWHTLPNSLSRGRDSEQQKLWQQVCSLLALLIEADLCGDHIDRGSLEHILEKLENIEMESTTTFGDYQTDTLPTNLL